MCANAQTRMRPWNKRHLRLLVSPTIQGAGVRPFVGNNTLASSSPLSRDDPLVRTRVGRRTGMHEYRAPSRHGVVLLGTASFYGDGVYDVAGKFLGEIEELVIDIHSGRVAYALTTVAGFPGSVEPRSLFPGAR